MAYFSDKYGIKIKKNMSELENIKSLEKYDAWKRAKKSRKTWMTTIAFFLAVLLAYIAGNMLMKVNLGETKKIFTYGFTDEKDLETANQSKLPSDYTEWYKKIKENPWTKKFGKKEEYFKKLAVKIPLDCGIYCQNQNCFSFRLKGQ
ncbi:MAG: hypothetical protein mread185_000047 [Mycoplasmataceae bacterium]|nr:MAG: hypothetical protein mread185_000047 [Mycoplasmataceae bacterium]